MPDVSDTAPKADAAAKTDLTPAGKDADTAGAPEELKNSFREALARKAGKNSHVESHLEGRHVGGGNNDTHKRQFRRKSG